MTIKFEVDLETLEEMAQCIHNCSWVSGEEIYTYMKGCVTGVNDYEPEEWSVDGKGIEAIDRDYIKQDNEALELQDARQRVQESNDRLENDEC